MKIVTTCYGVKITLPDTGDHYTLDSSIVIEDDNCNEIRLDENVQDPEEYFFDSGIIMPYLSKGLKLEALDNRYDIDDILESIEYEDIYNHEDFDESYYLKFKVLNGKYKNYTVWLSINWITPIVEPFNRLRRLSSSWKGMGKIKLPIKGK